MIPVLYSFRRCPYAMRARLALCASGVAYELREVTLKNKPDHLLQLSPKGTVPVLWLPDQTVIDESLDIMLWALEQSDPEGWLARLDADGLALITLNDETFKRHLDRYKYPVRFDLTAEQALSVHRAQGAVVLRSLDHLLGDQTYLSGSNWGFTDAAIAPFVRQFAHVDKAWFADQPWHKLALWLAQFESSTAFLTIMRREF
jgi:glutathione S-transferase